MGLYSNENETTYEIEVNQTEKKYVYLFQYKKTLIHQIYDQQKQLFLDFLSCFMK